MRDILVASVVHAWRRLNEPCKLRVDTPSFVADPMGRFVFMNGNNPYSTMEPVAAKEFVAHGVFGTLVFLAVCIQVLGLGSSSGGGGGGGGDFGGEPLGIFTPPMPPRWPWTPVRVLYSAATVDLPRTLRTLNEEGVSITSELASTLFRVAWYASMGVLTTSGWVFAWAQQRKFARVLDPTAHVKCCGVCMEAPKTIVMVPCGHQLCQSCAPKVDKCPQCRVAIADRVVVHE